ncbi:phosphopantetheine-binding protein, partial [Streptomyces aculeolatus]|uniref:phosphopantetheine-binding protein n=1 Tax=Streptomyces aculeolatus TaxID=270689 RepID=UPI001CED9D2A
TLRDLVASHVAFVLGHKTPTTIDGQRGFMELGFDSLAAVELRNRLNAVTELRLTASLIFDYPTVNALAEALHAQLRPSDESASPPIISELDRLENMLISMDSDQESRNRVAERLQALLWKLNQSEGTANGETEAVDLDVVSDDEMFNLIDKEFGLD